MAPATDDGRRKSRSELPKGAPAFVDGENRGRRTGKLIPAVQRDEDGFESIEGLFGSQAYSVNAPRQRQRKQAALTPVAEQSYGDDGSDMDITQVADADGDEFDDYSLPEAQPAPIAPPIRRQLPRRSSPGIDHVPSPRGAQYYSSQSLSQSQSTRKARAPLNSAIHRSHSAQRSSSPIQPEPDLRRASQSRRTTLGNGSGDMELDEDEEDLEEEQSYQTPAGGDDQDMDPAPQDDEEVDVDVISLPSSPARPVPSPIRKPKPEPAPKPTTAKSKPRARTPTPPPEDMEDDIASGLADLDNGPVEEDEEEEPEPEPKSKSKGKGKEKAKEKEKPKSGKRSRIAEDENEEGERTPSKKARAKGKEKERAQSAKPTVQSVGGKRKKRDFNAATPPNVRRSQRERFSPLEWWRNEKFIYGRSPDPEEGPLLVPLIKAIERPPKPDPIHLGAARHRGRKRGVKVKKEDPDELLDGEGVFGGPRTAEDGLDDETEELGVVLDYATQREVERRIAFPGARVEFTPTEGPFHFQKIFGDSDFFAAGLMKIPVGGRKPNKSSKENTYVFYCVSGAVEVIVHKSKFVIAPGGMFLAPRGNVYTISNVCQREAYIFFAQSRKILDDSEEPPPLPRGIASGSGEGKKTKAKVVEARR